ncbi:MAG: hypothetical protein M1830_000192 [Pleopsidium flavum]|nr:MAG: hypothetical protein M1830_000192 [Pleopsidium flavum]
MLLLHQTGSVKIGEVVRYTLTYTPSHDRILPSPTHLHVKVKNASAIPLRAAYLHGPYTLYAACYPLTFNPNYKHEKPWQGGVPDFEPNLKAGGSWNARLKVPDNIRESAGKANVKRTTTGGIPNFSWIIEISSQVIFSTSAVVHFELLVGRDETSLELSYAALGGTTHGTPGQLQDHQQGKRWKEGHGAAQPRGVYSKAVELVVDDTASLWNKPPLPEWNDEGKDRGTKAEYPDPGEEDVIAGTAERTASKAAVESRSSEGAKKRKVHLVVLTHGLHSNLGADMLYLKESIDATAKQAREDARKRRAKRQRKGGLMPPRSQEQKAGSKELEGSTQSTSTAPLSGGQEDLDDHSEGASDDDEEEVIVRGFSGNAVRTERGIQYLGKRLAKYVLTMTYPDQPFLPVKKSVTKALSRPFTGQSPAPDHDDQLAHSHSGIHKESRKTNHLAYRITSISFIAHSLGGLIQTYAIAYIHKHSPHFFQEIKPINFVAMASPFLGLSNENPIYVKFALDFGLVGRTGQDLGLTWRAPTVVRSGWGAMIGGIGTQGQRAHRHQDPGSKPLLRVLPTGPAHQVLKMFRNRTVYSNVVNDGIVPLRTSCLLFLDWRGLGRVEKARRENGLVGTMAGWGWSELIGANSSSHRPSRLWGDAGGSANDDENGSGRTSTLNGQDKSATVPQPSESATNEDTIEEQENPGSTRIPDGHGRSDQERVCDAGRAKESSSAQPTHPLSGLLSFLRANQQSKDNSQHPKRSRIYNRSQTTDGGGSEESGEASENASTGSTSSSATKRPVATRGDSILEDPNNVLAPPRTTFFESAGDILNPPLPDEHFIVDPSSRPRTIFHDRVYHPEDIPPPPPRRPNERRRSMSGGSRDGFPRSDTDNEHHSSNAANTGNMKVEEKIARAYHRELSWRKVLVRLEPDAHNNMIVRRMFSNAYGWPVIKHLVDTHFADTYTATTDDNQEPGDDRAKPVGEHASAHGEEVRGQSRKQHARTESERREAKDRVPALTSPAESNLVSNSARPRISREDSVQWDDAFFEVTDDESDLDTSSLVRRKPSFEEEEGNEMSAPRGTSEAEIDDFLSASASTPPNVRPAAVTTKSLGSATAESVVGGMSSLGLRRSVEEQVGSPSGSGLLGNKPKPWS